MMEIGCRKNGKHNGGSSWLFNVILGRFLNYFKGGLSLKISDSYILKSYIIIKSFLDYMLRAQSFHFSSDFLIEVMNIMHILGVFFSFFSNKRSGENAIQYYLILSSYISCCMRR